MKLKHSLVVREVVMKEVRKVGVGIAPTASVERAEHVRDLNA